MLDMKQGEIDAFFWPLVSYSYRGWGVMSFGSDDEKYQTMQRFRPIY